jgi:hypothetical protein
MNKINQDLLFILYYSFEVHLNLCISKKFINYLLESLSSQSYNCNNKTSNGFLDIEARMTLHGLLDRRVQC